MRTRVWAVLAVALGIPVLVSAGGGTVEVKVVKYKDMGDLVLKNRGKVVVVDFWTTGCVPCKKEMPNLVALHNKYAKDGLVAITANLDVPKDREQQMVNESRLRFLNKVKATFDNLLLDEPESVWQKLNIEAVPCVLVFDRQGKYYRFGGSADAPRPAEYKEIEPLVVELLKKK
jgi:thiol-disulfide isomerase/thioredoxin